MHIYGYFASNHMLFPALVNTTINVFYIENSRYSVALPDLSTQGAYQLEIISAGSEGFKRLQR